MQRAIAADAHGGKEWHREVPGTRWFKADLHIHTVDDMPGGRAKMPDGMGKYDRISDTIPEYSRRFLQAAVDKGVQVLGITPHSPRMGDSNGDSAVWGIVDEWKDGKDYNGIPFRDSIYAVFPGFEPSFNNGGDGLHLLFLFDYSIKRRAFMKAFDLVMDNVSPWRNGSNNLHLSKLSAETALERLKKFHESECGNAQDGASCWNYMILAPHADNEKGLFGALKAQVLAQFPHNEIAGIGLGQTKLPEEMESGKEWLQDAMGKRNQSFFHGSDAYRMNDIGSRCTWIKIASPRITALRQAFIAGQPRIGIGYERGPDGALFEISRTPDALADKRPWLRSVTVSGGASFFGSNDSDTGCTRFDFSPDLTCIIGGSMTGKSTLLDGLRTYTDAPMPQDPESRRQVEARGRDRFLAGSPEVELDCPSRDKTAPPREQWPAIFYTQSELQQLAGNSNIMEILSQLAVSEKKRIVEIEEKLSMLDNDLITDAKQFKNISDRRADAEQAYERSKRAVQEIEAFSSAGIGELGRASSEAHQWQEAAATINELGGEIARLADEVKETEMPEIKERTDDALQDTSQSQANLHTAWSRVRDLLYAAKKEAESANSTVRSIASSAKANEGDMRVKVDRRLAKLGHGGARINQLQSTNVQASLCESYRANLEDVRSNLNKIDESFAARRAERKKLVRMHRGVFDRVIKAVDRRFGGRIKASRIDDGDTQKMDDFIRSLGQRGITRWWNDLAGGQRPAPDILLEKADAKRLNDVGMSDAVGASFLTHLTPASRRELAALRCKDTYHLEFRMDDGTYRKLADLSGGQRMNLLLSLLLETDDERPLIIDQPEDELDNRFLLETLLPALRKLKGRRQVILATHNANIVVNGDADQVIHLEATANRGWAAHSGAIDKPDVRNAIIRTVDGGKEAFRMRKLKYGF